MLQLYIGRTDTQLRDAAVEVLGITDRVYVNPARTEVCGGGSLFEDGDELDALCVVFFQLHVHSLDASTYLVSYAQFTKSTGWIKYEKLVLAGLLLLQCLGQPQWRVTRTPIQCVVVALLPIKMHVAHM
jgi:hypothetical protein